MPVASGRWPVPAAGQTASAPAAEPISGVVAVSNFAQAVVDASDIEAAPMPAVVPPPPVGKPLPPPAPSFASSQSPQSTPHSR